MPTVKPAAYTHWLKKIGGEIKVLKPNGTGFTAAHGEPGRNFYGEILSER